MPSPFDFDGNGVLEIVSDPSSSSSPLFESSSSFLHKWNHKTLGKINWCFGGEPTSVLDSIGSPTSTSTLSSSFGGGGSTTALQIGSGTATATTAVGGGAGAEKCGMGMDYWESQEQEQSILRWIMGDLDDPSMGLNKLLQPGGGPTAAEFEFNGGFNASNQDFGLELDPVGPNLMGSFINPTPGFPYNNQSNHHPNYKLSNPRNPNLSSNDFNPPLESQDLKPQIFNPPLLVNQSQITQNPSFFQPLQYPNQEHPHILAPPAKRNNPSDSMLQLHPYYLNQRPHPMGQPKPKTAAEELQQGIIDQLYTAAELVSAGNPPPLAAQAILARLNHQLSPMGKPFQRAAFFCKEALLQLLLHTDNHHPPPNSSSPFNLILKIGAYKSFSEISPIIQFSNFTCNQALLEALDGYDRIHVIDFDIGYGGQWASLMHELSMRNTGALSLKITAFASPSTHDQLELGLTAENLNHFACEMKMAFEFDIMNLDSLNSGSWSFPIHVSENEAVAVNLPVGSFSNYQMSLPVILRFVKQLSPKIVVSMDRSSDRTDLQFPNHVIHTLQTYTSLLESLDAVNVNTDALQKIERFLIQPDMVKIIMGRLSSPEKTPNWRNLFLSSGFSPLTFSNFTESQAECVVKRTPVRGFHIERRQSSLVLCWQRKELISASAWKC
ncbi:hypothetical protein RHMOL_Rhmol01G0188300 [Rhododendron molle]|uniref:Uncharacterized protein n=1 Tax=Rhododendron molle TaxID=49168 RepID=A0ACC0Q4E0_RHOML|nr:hypothetical protein RHMOL_Rhmol01G0188300 [Rhododendron molle]